MTRTSRSGCICSIYAFHMPAFAIISGYFSKSDAPGSRQMARVITDILLPYVIFEALWTLTKWIVEGQANPNLTSRRGRCGSCSRSASSGSSCRTSRCCAGRCCGPCVISIGAGYLPNIDSTLSLSRTLGLLPFFALGWWLRERDVVDRLGLLRDRPWWVFVVAARAPRRSRAGPRGSSSTYGAR